MEAFSNSLIDELQKQALDDSQSVTVLLRKALVVATKLNLTDAVDWIEKELAGWEGIPRSEIPEWRRVRGNVVIRSPYHGWQPVAFGAAKDAEFFSTIPVGNPATELEALMGREPGGELQFSYPPEIEISLQRSIDTSFPIRCNVSRSVVNRIVEEIRNKILRWSLELDKAGIRGEGFSFTQAEKQQAHNIHINVYGGAANIGSIASIGDVENVITFNSNTIQNVQISELVTEVKKYIHFLELGAQQQQLVDNILLELENEAALPAPEPNKVVGLAKNLLGYVGKTANKVIEAGIKAYIEGWIKAHGGF